MHNIQVSKHVPTSEDQRTKYKVEMIAGEVSLQANCQHGGESGLEPEATLPPQGYSGLFHVVGQPLLKFAWAEHLVLVDSCTWEGMWKNTVFVVLFFHC